MAEKTRTQVVVSRKEALLRGLPFYFTGKQCKRGHIALRRLINNGCMECQQETLQIWRNDNREHVRKRDNSYRKRTAGRHNELERARYSSNPEKFRKKTRDQYKRNGETIRAKRRAYHQKIYLDESVRKIAQERARQWAEENPERAFANAKLTRDRRRARYKSAAGEYTYKDIAAIKKAQRNRCAYCRKPLKSGCHIDHIVPLARGGTNEPRNLQALCRACNLSKHARDPIDHARTLGLLV